MIIYNKTWSILIQFIRIIVSDDNLENTKVGPLDKPLQDKRQSAALKEA